MPKSIKNEPYTKSLYPSLSQSPIHDTNTMSLEINTLLKLIPTFDTAETQQVYRFVRSCDSAFLLADAEKEQILLVYALNNITGTCASDVHSRQYTSWEDLKSYLIEKFSNVKTISHLNLELQSMFQKPAESITDFFHRVDLCRSKIIEKLNTEIKDSTLLGRMATTEETALSVFVNGLSSEIGTMLRTRGFQNLTLAGRFAIEEEKIRAMNTARQSLFKNNTNQHKPSSQRTQIVPNPRATYNSYPSSPKICNYCKNPGHLISECRKRAYNNNLRNNIQPNPLIQNSLPASLAQTHTSTNATCSTSSSSLCK
ncbi:uncharacterized protein LOC123875868 [Maniola jurtina]|uniref:uncharacterized protein LOC123875868 n=1 Tax=Maniola jurtina TaxID=191418 RepID=UPI001E68926A|nr:uncharacterized protein LOC123875868 [Maniola jurtina]